MKKINQLLRFDPILKERIWGGEKLKTLLSKKSDKKNIGESWEISDVDKDISIVLKGSLKGRKLKDLISEYKGDLVGNKIYRQFGENFPLLIKFVDAKEALSIQLHPDDKLAKERHNSFGKTEMWYVIQANEKSNLIVGFKKDTNKQEYLHHLENKTLPNILNFDEAKEGDAYFIPTGRIHAIGGGVLLAEIQQTSDITYRIYDWERQDNNGNYRELHTEQAIEAIDYKAHKSYKTEYQKKKNESIEIISCHYFTTNILPIEKAFSFSVNHSAKDSFVIYICVKGEVLVEFNQQSELLEIGQTLLVPACINKIKISSNMNSELLEVFIN